MRYHRNFVMMFAIMFLTTMFSFAQDTPPKDGDKGKQPPVQADGEKKGDEKPAAESKKDDDKKPEPAEPKKDDAKPETITLKEHRAALRAVREEYQGKWDATVADVEKLRELAKANEQRLEQRLEQATGAYANKAMEADALKAENEKLRSGTKVPALEKQIEDLGNLTAAQRKDIAGLVAAGSAKDEKVKALEQALAARTAEMNAAIARWAELKKSAPEQKTQPEVVKQPETAEQKPNGSEAKPPPAVAAKKLTELEQWAELNKQLERDLQRK